MFLLLVCELHFVLQWYFFIGLSCSCRFGAALTAVVW